jgi:hypothetical protein
MGQDIDEVRFTREDRQRYREKVKLDLDVLRRLLDAGAFETGRKLMGIEVEFHVVGSDGDPAMINAELLRRIENADFQTELAQFNIEFNVAPHKLTGTVFREIEEELETSQRYAQSQARGLDAHVVTIGILPTLSDLHTTIQNLSANPRYHLLNEQILEARGEDLVLEIEGTEKLELSTSSIVMEAAATSVQLHLQVSPDGFARTWKRCSGDQRRPGGGRRQLPVPVRQGAVARDPHRPVPADHRHAHRGARRAGCAAARVVR